jgi:argininosuccinate lyase
MKLWEKGQATNQQIEKFTIGQDPILDLELAPFDIQGTLAHIIMLESIGLLSSAELAALKPELVQLHALALSGGLKIETGMEDIHSQIELLLTQKLGEVGKKIHSGRSRNDQVLTAIKLFTRAEIQAIVLETKQLFDLLLQLSQTYQNHLIPGYTHLQVAMPSSIGLWLGAYAESLSDDLLVLQSVYRLVNQNPLGSAAGYGSSFPLNREMTTQLLGFETMNYNVIYAQMTRGKTEKNTAFALTNLAATLSKLAYDAILYMNQNFGFIGFPDELTTGSSIMPHKKNPDVWELIRAKCNQIQALPYELTLISNNLPSGYHRDWQILKEHFFPAFNTLRQCLQMTQLMLANLEVKSNILADEKYQYLFSVEVVNELVLKGLAFREAYQTVGKQIAEGSFKPSPTLQHTHLGSIGNLAISEIETKMQTIYQSYQFEKVEAAINQLLGK